MSLFDLGLFDTSKPVTVPLSRPPSFLDRYGIKPGFPELAPSRTSDIDWSALSGRGAVAPRPANVDTGPAFGGDAPVPTPRRERSSIDDLLRRADGILDKWGDFPPPDDGAVDFPRRRAMTPMEGPDTGDENPNAGVLPRDYYAHLRGPEGTKSNYDAVNPVTGASGPYQFLRSTWADLMKTAPQLGLSWEGFYSPSKNKGQHDAAIHEFTDRNARRLATQLGRAPTAGELYATHLLGGAGGAALLGNLDAPAQRSISDAVFNSNPWMKPYRTKPGKALLARFESMMSGE